MPPHWIAAVARVYTPLSILTALLVAADIFLLHRRQRMAIMDAVWPLTMLYFGPLGLIFYAWFGRAPATPGAAPAESRPMWQATFNGASHCGAGCALGDVLGDWIAFLTGFALFGSLFAGRLLSGFLLAYLFGILFQYFSVAPMRGLSLRQGLAAAIRIDTLSLLAYQIGMFGFMAMTASLYPGLEPTRWAYWLLMQAAMLVGFLTTFPVNWLLIARGVKEKM